MEKELSQLQKDFQEFFNKLLEIYSVKSPAELSEEDRKKFFSSISSLWKNGEGPVDKWEEKAKEIKNEKSESLFKIFTNANILKTLSESAVGERGKTTEDDAIDFITKNPYIINIIKNLVKEVGGKTVFKLIYHIIFEEELTVSAEKDKKIKQRKLEKNFKGHFVK